MNFSFNRKLRGFASSIAIFSLIMSMFTGAAYAAATPAKITLTANQNSAVGQLSAVAPNRLQSANTPGTTQAGAIVDRIIIELLDTRLTIDGVTIATVIGHRTDNTYVDLSDSASWETSDPAVATVTPSGLIFAVSAGEVRITVKYQNLKNDMILTVINQDQDSIDPIWTSQELRVGGSVSAGLRVTHSDGYSEVIDPYYVQWYSDVPSVATVSDGRIEAISQGTTTIYGEYQSKSFTFEVIVDNTAPIREVEVSANFFSGEYELNRGFRLQLQVHYNDGSTNYPDNSEVTWASSDANIATVDSEGWVDLIALGQADISGLIEGTLHTITVKVVPPDFDDMPTPLTTTQGWTAKSVYVGTIAFPYLNEDYGEGLIFEVNGYLIKWSSSNEAVATVSNTGVVDTLAIGTATITAEYYGKIYEFEITVEKAPINDISIADDNVRLYTGDTHEITVEADFLNGDHGPADPQDLSFYSVDPSIATVDANGVVTAVSAGSTTIMVSNIITTVNIAITVVKAPADPVVGRTPKPNAPKLPTIPEQPTVDRPIFKEGIVNPAAAWAIYIRQESAQPISFPDVPSNAWSHDLIQRAAQMGIVQGYADGSYHPNANVTRAEFATMIVKAFGLTHTGGRGFADTRASWAAEAINTLQAAGIISGYADGTFHPNQEISRAEMATMLSRLTTFTQPTASPFADVQPNWASDAINAFAAAGIVSGKDGDKFVPNDSATRAESAAMIVRMLDRLFGR
jgi:uncharacterized protein YjdB